MTLRILCGAVCGALAWLAGTAPAEAQSPCGGIDLLPVMAAEHPEAFARFEARTAQVAHAEGRLWRIDAWGTEPSYVIGTFHDTEMGIIAVNATITGLIENADRLLVEISPEEAEQLATRMMTDPAFMLDEDGPPLEERIEPALLPVLERLLADLGMTIAELREVKVWVLFGLFAAPPCELTAQNFALEMDSVLMQIAQERGIEIIGLETVDQAFASFDRLSDAEINLFLNDTLRVLTRFTAEDLRRTNTTFYLDGRIMAVWHFALLLSEVAGSDPAVMAGAYAAFWDSLLITRNRAWAPAFIAALEQGNSVIAVGALHLPGEHGLIEIARRAGFGVTRLDPNAPIPKP